MRCNRKKKKKAGTFYQVVLRKGREADQMGNAAWRGSDCGTRGEKGDRKGNWLLDDGSATQHPWSLLHATSIAGSPRGPGAVVEGVWTDVDRAGRQRDHAQGRALAEGGRSNLGEVVRQRDLAQGRALLEGGCSNLREVGRQRDLAQGRALLEGG